MAVRYVGSGPYCYANCMAMALADGTEPGLLEVLTGSPFGLELLGGRRPLFNPLGWDPGIGIDAALGLLGWSCERSDGGDADTALQRLRDAAASGPVLAGPLEMGLLPYQPDAAGAIGADHYLLVFAVDGDLVRFHDPHGHPYAALPAAAFAAAWRADSIGYAHAEYTMRASFRRVRAVNALDALRASVPAAAAWLAAEPTRASTGSLGTEQAAWALAGLAEAGLTDDQREDLIWFAVRVGARRLADAEYWLGQIGRHTAAMVAGAQARLVGALQYPLVIGDDAMVAQIMRDLAPTYQELRQALSAP